MRKKDVVHMHPHTAFERRQNLEKLVTNIAAKLHRVTRIDEENVVRFECGEETDIELFDALGDQVHTRTVEPLVRMWLDAGESTGLIRGGRSGGDARWVTAAHLAGAARPWLHK